MTGSITGSRSADLLAAANLLMDARRTFAPIEALPEALRPRTVDEAYFVQDQLALAYEPVGGWKVGASSAGATPLFAPMPQMWMSTEPVSKEGRMRRFQAVEAEIAFLLGEDLPVRSEVYSREEVLNAVQSCHPAIEVLGSAYQDPMAVGWLENVADLQMHGGFGFGPGFADWREVNFAAEQVTLAIDGSVRVERTGSNAAGDLLGLLPWLANHGGRRTGGLKAGQWITTGSWTGNTLATGAGTVDVRFSRVGRVTVRLG